MTRKSARTALDRARRLEVMIATAESCTGGMVAAALTDIAGSSDVFERGFVTYSNEAKQEMLGVRSETLAAHGAVSSETAGEMALGALENSRAQIAISVTGIAGPSGGSLEKPVGLVWFAVASKPSHVEVQSRQFDQGSRSAIREAAVETALDLLNRRLETLAACA